MSEMMQVPSAGKDIERITNEILDELVEEERAEEARKAAIIAAGCPHTNKNRHTGTFTGLDFLECDVCRKQFWLDGRPIE